MKVNARFLVLLLVVFLTVASRTLPHIFNFTPVTAVALFGAAYLSNRWVAFALPLVSLFVSDFWLNNTVYRAFYPNVNGTVWFANGEIYIAFALITLFGLFALRTKNFRVENVLGTSIAASLFFFFWTNGAVWASSGMYSKDFAGLTACLWAGVPFLQNAMLGDLFYVGLLFGGFEWAKQRWAAFA